MKILPINLEDLIHARSVESVRREFKKTWSEHVRESVIHSICAFANDFFNLNGGYIIIGIEGNDGQPVRATRSHITDCPKWAAPSIRSDPTVERVDGNVCTVSSQDNVEQYENPTYISCQDKKRYEERNANHCKSRHAR